MRYPKAFVSKLSDAEGEAAEIQTRLTARNIVNFIEVVASCQT